METKLDGTRYEGQYRDDKRQGLGCLWVWSKHAYEDARHQIGQWDRDEYMSMTPRLCCDSVPPKEKFLGTEESRSMDTHYGQSKQGLQLLNAVNAARVAELDRQNARRSEIATQMADVPKGMVFGSNAGNQVKKMPQFLSQYASIYTVTELSHIYCTKQHATIASKESVEGKEGDALALAGAVAEDISTFKLGGYKDKSAMMKGAMRFAQVRKII